jgi:alditol oxidase
MSGGTRPVNTCSVNTRLVNWAGNVSYQCSDFRSPSSVRELQALVARSRRLRAVGTRHSFSELADTTGTLVSTAGLPPGIEVDSAAPAAKVAAGVRYAELARYLDDKGFALPNLASLPHISVAGACATATHGSGTRSGCLATSVSGLEMITADGDLVAIGRGSEHFDGTVVGLGALGIVVSVTLDLVPAFRMRQWVYEDLPLEVLDDHFDDLAACAYSVGFFTDWREPRLTQIWIGQRADEDEPSLVTAPWFTARPAPAPRHPVPGFSAANCTQQLGVPGPWHDRLPHFRPAAEPSSAGNELHSEYMVSSQDAIRALHAVRSIGERIHPVLQVCEIRTVAADGLWMSPFLGRDSVCMHFTWIADMRAVLPAVELVERQLAPLGARPHWGKIFSISPADMRPLYPRLDDFAGLARRHDPKGKFGNAFLDRYLNVAT